MTIKPMEDELSYRDELFARFYEIQKAIDTAVANNEPTENLLKQKKELKDKIEKP